MAVTELRQITTEDGARISYELRTAPEGSPTIVALHGVLVGTSNWVHQVLRLPQFQWIVPSFRGHGESSPAGEHPTIEQAALDTVAILDAEGIDRAVVIGNSLGATVALALGLLRPERVIGLLLAEPSVPALLPDRGGDRLSAAAKRAEVLLAEGKVDEALDLFLTPRLGPDWSERIGGRRLKEWRRNVASTPAWFDAVINFDPGPGPLAGLSVPTLLVYGANTQAVYRELTDAVADVIPYEDLVAVPDAGHGVPVDNPEAFNTLLIEFLARLGLPVNG